MERTLSLFLLGLICLWVGAGCTRVSSQLVGQLPGGQTRSVSWNRLPAEVSSVIFQVWDPYEKREVGFRGVEARALLDHLFGEAWRHADEIQVGCLDGYQALIPAERFLQYRSWFAFERTDQPRFDLKKTDTGREERVLLAPAYLVWDTLGEPKLRGDSDFGWPYQASTIQLVRFSETFPRVLLPPGAGKSARSGFLHFKRHCLKCHSVNGQGARVGPELNFPLNVTEYLGREHLKMWILKPSAVRWRTQMPPLPAEVRERAQVADEIIDYLEAMKRRKIAPL